MSNNTQTIGLHKIPSDMQELCEIAQDCFESPFKMAALSVAVLCNYEKNPDLTFEMLDFIKGPRPLSNLDKQFIRDRLAGKGYVVRSYFNGTSPENNYEVNPPLEIEVSENPYSFQNDGYATLYLKSSGADSPRPVTLRFKPSTNQWFLWEHTFLSDIRLPASQNDWA